MSAYEPQLKLLAIASGKGGVGKTNVSVNLAVALARLSRRVMLFDADLGLANADLLLGVRPQRTLYDLVSGEVDDLGSILVEGPDGILLVPAISGVASMANMSTTEHAGLIRAFSSYREPLDVLIVDTAAGVQGSVTSFCKAVQDVLVVVCDEPASMADAYALIKVLHQDHGLRRFRLVCNMMVNAEAGRRVAQNLATVLTQYLPDVVVELSGIIPLDEHLRRAVQKRVPVVNLYPASASARAFAELARRVDGWKTARSNHGGLGFFVERLLAHA
ncbi:MinD/ParA family protein [Rhabdochromatium marinum]|uniref:MinD/ParA family protein n=1 Tax=Rhabdochromatium marinum TaxID=48729 RepID=UPI001905D4F0|nr:MinD/ParA family protein [Rhabdochromatium marinum]MBK1647448.1 cobyrinic acid a,c-diamide synthase [Rhabdochromatium marinum]